MHRPAGESIGDDATEQQERHERQCVGGEHDPDVPRITSQVSNEQPDSDDDERVAEDARALAQPKPTEVGMTQDGPHVCRR